MARVAAAAAYEALMIAWLFAYVRQEPDLPRWSHWLLALVLPVLPHVAVGFAIDRDWAVALVSVPFLIELGSALRGCGADDTFCFGPTAHFMIALALLFLGGPLLALGLHVRRRAEWTTPRRPGQG